MLDIKQKIESLIIPENHPWVAKLQPLWEELKDLPHFGEMAIIRAGRNTRLNSANGHANGHPAVNGHLNDHTPGKMEPNPEIDFEPYFGRPSSMLQSESRQPEATSTPQKRPKVIVFLNEKDERWPLSAAIDEQGRPCPTDAYALWPRGDLPVEVLAALLNSPILNASLSLHRVTKETFRSLLRSIPVPRFTYWQIPQIRSLVRNYRKMREEWLRDPVQIGPADCTGQGRFEQLESELIGYYQLSLSAERALQAYFAGYRRPGPFSLTQIESSPQNRIYNTSIYVEDVKNEGDEKIVAASVLSWREPPEPTIHFPLALVPPQEQGKVAKDVFLFVKMNLGAADVKDLIVEDITVAPPIREEFRAIFG